VVKKSNTKIFIIAGVIIFMLFVVMGGALAFVQMQPAQLASTPIPSTMPVQSNSPVQTRTPENDTWSIDSSNLKVYENSEIGFSVSYPQDFKIKTNSYFKQNDSVDIQKSGPTQKSDTEVYDGIGLLFVKINHEGQTLDKYISERIGLIDKEETKILEDPKELEVNGINGLTYTTQRMGDITNRHIYLPIDSETAILILDYTVDPGALGFSEIVNQILSTFKFTE
jgi:hypothetical protein